MFKLPIEYVPHHQVPPSVTEELELIQSKETPIYHRIFKPPSEWVSTANQLASVYTTDTTFLKESKKVYRSYSPINTSFLTHWKQLKENKEFKLTYQYLESKYVSSLNESPTFLFIISMYFVISPLLFILTPLLMLLLPFVLLAQKGWPLEWKTYFLLFRMHSSKHPLFALLQYSQMNSSQQTNIMVGVVFFCIQLYVNIYTLCNFYKNLTHVHKVMLTAKEYATHTLKRMSELKRHIRRLPSYQEFYQHLLVQETQLTVYLNKWSSPLTLWYCGSNRTFFYELYNNAELNTLIEYTIGLNGYLHCMQSLQSLKPCTFSTKTSFKQAYYPIEEPVKNTYSLQNMVVTGPNASGKTTFLKMTMINVLLSQQFGRGFYKSAVICPYEKFACYINIPDTCGRDSLFQAEARRCKEIIDADKTERTLCIFDELFSGTNPEEAVATGSSMLRYLLPYSTFDFLLTTHFIDLCKEMNELPMKHMNNYKLKKGISFVKGGIKVLEEMKFPSSIVNQAKHYADK